MGGEIAVCGPGEAEDCGWEEGLEEVGAEEEGEGWQGRSSMGRHGGRWCVWSGGGMCRVKVGQNGFKKVSGDVVRFKRSELVSLGVASYY